jgi:hypothetical protein
MKCNKTIALLSIKKKTAVVYKLCNTSLEAELNFVSWHLYGVYSGEMDHALILRSSEALLCAI